MDWMEKNPPLCYALDGRSTTPKYRMEIRFPNFELEGTWVKLLKAIETTNTQGVDPQKLDTMVMWIWSHPELVYATATTAATGGIGYGQKTIFT